MEGEDLVTRMALAIEENISAALPSGVVIDYRYAAAAALKVAADAFKGAFLKGYEDAL